ncbi:MAG: GGDEF domain-containing protein [Gammaproteobacteria bacterium]|nr:GGDEF domain-containing protein [Gammaproteobacteria bacterium]
MIKMKPKKSPVDPLTHGALDTLSTVMRVLGEESFPLDNDVEAERFPLICGAFAGHVENGAAVPSHNIEVSADGSRQWSQVRRFFVDRRRAESKFVSKRLKDYRGVVEDLISGLRQIGERDQTTESQVVESLQRIESAVETGELPDIKAVLTETVDFIGETFAEQKKLYEQQLSELNNRMAHLRQDLVAAREEMKRDPLTDAYNRGAFDSAIEQSLNMHFILNQPVTLIMIDLDKFKAVNDNFGHAAGDAVLKAVAEKLERTFIRKNDLVARYGGDEFAVILNDTSADNAVRLIERFLAEAQNISIEQAPGETLVSCSAGFTEIHETDTVTSLSARADKALYTAKAAGRNTARRLLIDEAAEQAR